MAYIQENHVVHHPITPDTIIFTEYNENLKLINVGYDRTKSLSEQDTADDIASYGRAFNEASTVSRLRSRACAGWPGSAKTRRTPTAPSPTCSWP